MHLKKVTVNPEKYPDTTMYPFNLEIFSKPQEIHFSTRVTFFIGENGTGKSTLLEAITKKCGIYIWGNDYRPRYIKNPHEKNFYKALNIEWTNGSVPGSFFSSQIFKNFSLLLDEWAIADPANLQYFGGQSLITQSHGQSLMSYFKARYKIKGIYFLDEPETALSPKSQLEFLKLLNRISETGNGQFIIATHSPILLACPDADIYCFNEIPIKKVRYEDTEYFHIYKNFMEDRKQYLNQL